MNANNNTFEQARSGNTGGTPNTKAANANSVPPVDTENGSALPEIDDLKYTTAASKTNGHDANNMPQTFETAAEGVHMSPGSESDATSITLGNDSEDLSMPLKKPGNFFDLPREIRDEVYRYFFLHDGAVSPDDLSKYSTPRRRVLRVSPRIREVCTLSRSYHKYWVIEC